MGYNGNNRGRTHNWSGVKNKKDYNWGLNLIGMAIVGLFYILVALTDLIIDVVTSIKTNASDNDTSVKPSVKEEK